jgi:hypothetical protein
MWLVLRGLLASTQCGGDLRRHHLRFQLQYRLPPVRQLLPGKQQPDELRHLMHGLPITGERNSILRRNEVRVCLQRGLSLVWYDLRVQRQHRELWRDLVHGVRCARRQLGDLQRY